MNEIEEMIETTPGDYLPVSDLEAFIDTCGLTERGGVKMNAAAAKAVDEVEHYGFTTNYKRPYKAVPTIQWLNKRPLFTAAIIASPVWFMCAYAFSTVWGAR